MFGSKKFAKQQALLDKAETYAEWSEAAAAYDTATGAARWRKTEQTNQYDYAQIQQRLERLQSFRQEGDNLALMFTLNEGVHGNMGGMGKSGLYQKSILGTKYLIEDYVSEICNSLNHIANVSDKEISYKDKKDLFQRASLCYGRSALMLSGGGSLGHFHLGVLKALMEQDLVPKVISGASAGSFVAAIFGTRTHQDMQTYIHSETLIKEAKEKAGWLNRFLDNGDNSDQIDILEVEEAINHLIPDLTFQEAYELSGYQINISIAPAELHQTSRLLNAITSPNVFVRTAVMASCAVPGVYPAVTLQAKNYKGESQPYLPTRKWVDGSVSDDLPAKRLSRLYGVNHYIGSLINPIVMYTNEKSVERGGVGEFARNMGHRSITGLAKNMQLMTQKYGKDWPRLKFYSSMANSIFSQSYDADIAIFPNFDSFDMRKIISPLSEDELVKLIDQGERATWRKMGMIRTCSKISRTLDDILLEYSGDKRKVKKLKAIA